MKGRTHMQRCTMKLRSRHNTSINLASGERLRQLKLIVYFLKTRTSRHFFQQLKIIQCQFYELLKVEQEAAELITCKQRKTKGNKNVDIEHEAYLDNQNIRNQNNVKVVGSMKTNGSQQNIQTWLCSPMSEGGESYF